MKYLILLSMLLLDSGIQAFDTPEVQELRKEVLQLRKEVRRLEKRVMALEPDTPKGHSMQWGCCLLYTSPSPRDVEESRMPSSA